MASPRSNRPSTPGPSDRRMRGQKPQRPDRRMQRPRHQGERGRRNLFIMLGVAILLVIGGIVGYGYYDKRVAPHKALAARVGDTRYTQGDLVKRMRMLQAASIAGGEPLDLSIVPFEVLNDMADAELIRRAAPGYNIRVTDKDIEAGLQARFAPTIPEGQGIRPGQVQQEYREVYLRFLNTSHLSDKDYRKIVEEAIYETALRDALGQQVPIITEHVEVYWMKLASGVPIQGGVPAGSSPEEVVERLQEDDFEDVARDVSVESRYSDPNGYVGWVPKGAFTFLDKALAGSEEEDPLALNEISRPLSTQEGTYLIKVTAGPEEREISETMRERLKDVVLRNWLLDQGNIGRQEGWYEVNFNSKIYAWVVDQVGLTRPRDTLEEGG